MFRGGEWPPRAGRLATNDVRIHFGIRVTSPARTLLDCAPRMGVRALTRAVNDARIARRLRMLDLVDVVKRNPHHPGAARLAPLLGTGAPTRSPLEDKFLRFCKRFGLPRPNVNTTVGGHEVDAFFEAERVIVELDGYESHSDPSTFESDRERDAHALASGLPTIRITEKRLDNAPAREAERLHAILRARRWCGLAARLRSRLVLRSHSVVPGRGRTPLELAVELDVDPLVEEAEHPRDPRDLLQRLLVDPDQVLG